MSKAESKVVESSPAAPARVSGPVPVVAVVSLIESAFLYAIIYRLPMRDLGPFGADIKAFFLGGLTSSRPGEAVIVGALRQGRIKHIVLSHCASSDLPIHPISVGNERLVWKTQGENNRTRVNCRQSRSFERHIKVDKVANVEIRRGIWHL